jgi:hypothetical protein
MQRRSQVTPDSSDIILKLLVFLSADEDQLTRFLALSGLLPQDLRTRHGEPVFQGFLLDYLFQDDEATAAFCSELQVQPETLMRLRQKLPGGAGEWNGSD